MAIIKLTKTNIENIPYPLSGQKFYHDTDLSCFMLTVGKKTKTFFVQASISGKLSRIKIGRYGVYTAEQARMCAKEMFIDISKGINPKEKERDEKTKNITFEVVLNEYIKNSRRLKERTKKNYRDILNRHVPDWMKKPLSQIKKNDVIERHTRIGLTQGEYVANATMRILRTLFNYAKATYEICPDNPVEHLSRTKSWYKEEKRQNYIKAKDIPIFFDAVNKLPNQTYRDFFLLILFTGLRRNEAAKLKWEDINFENRTLIIEETKNGRKHELPLSNFLFNLLSTRFTASNKDTKWVFSGTGKTGHFIEPKKGIAQILEQTGITFSTHDLRRTFITIAESIDLSDFTLKRLLNHKSNDVTAGYIIHNVDRLREPMEKISQRIILQANAK